MANQQEIEETYNFMDEIFRLSFGDNASISCGYYGDDFSKTLDQSQEDKHKFILESINFKPGFRVLDIGCGWGPLLKFIKEKGGHGIGLTLSSKQAKGCQRTGLEAYLKNWRDVTVDTFGAFDAVVCLGAFEHFCSVEEYLAGKQDEVYDRFFRLCYDVLPENGRFYYQGMMWGKNAPPYEKVSVNAPKGSDEYIVAVVGKFYPGSWPPYGREHLLRGAQPYFEELYHSNCQLDWIHTMEELDKVWNFSLSNLRPPYFSFRRLFAIAKLFPRLMVDKNFRYQKEFLRNSYNKECLIREILDEERIVFQKKSAQSEPATNA
jgi:cyclopropane-fatty-acyl-phospholipid synthase